MPHRKQVKTGRVCKPHAMILKTHWKEVQVVDHNGFMYYDWSREPDAPDYVKRDIVTTYED